MRAEDLKNRYNELFGGDPRIFRAPGRTNLIGEHTDYNEGFVMPAAIEFQAWVAVGRRDLDDRRVVVHSHEWNETVDFSLDETDSSPRHSWSDYIRGVAIQLQLAGYKIHGSNLLIYSDVPIGAGLSSSAALEVAGALALIWSGTPSTESEKFDRVQLPKLCQRAENETVGARCGIMDQFASVNGRAGHALLLDCRSLDFELLHLPPDLSLVLCNTMVPHRNVSGEYNLRRAQCEQGARYFAERIPGVLALRDVSREQLEKYRQDLDDMIFRRCRHVITENGRTLEAAKALEVGNGQRFGELMYESHRSLKNDYEVSCAELDVMVDLASNFPGVYGARMTGGGFGGCTINLVSKPRVSEFTANISKMYKIKTGIESQIYVTGAADGAGPVTGD